MSALTDWITASASTVSALSIVFVAAQTVLLRRQVSADHERSRRERAVEMIRHWSNTLQRESSSARKFVEALSEQQTIDLFHQKALTVSKDLEPHVLACLARTGATIPRVEGQSLQIDEGAVSQVRWLAITYLNSLESIMVAWRHNVADRDIISEQFSYLVDDRMGYNALERLRKVAGGRDSYPALEEFFVNLRQRRAVAAGKQPVG